MERLHRLSRHLTAHPVAHGPQTLPNFIAGAFVASNATESIAVTDPASGEEIARVPRGTAQDVDARQEAEEMKTSYDHPGGLAIDLHDMISYIAYDVGFGSLGAF